MDDITSGDIATAEKSLDSASPAESTTDTTASPDAAPRQQPVAPETTDDRYKGWIPPDAHERVVDGFHRRLDSLSWAQGLTREEVQEALALRRQVIERQQQGATPPPDARDDRGEPYYSATQATAMARFEVERAVEKLREEFAERLTPIESRWKEDSRLSELNNEVQNASALPGFNDHIDAMTQYVAEMNERRARGERLPILSARDVYDKVVLPKVATLTESRQAELKKQWLAELYNSKAVVRDDINPARPASATREKSSGIVTASAIAEEMERRKRA